MHSLSDFTPYTDQALTGGRLYGETIVLVWSQKTGYYFSQLGFISDFDCVKLIAVKN